MYPFLNTILPYDCAEKLTALLDEGIVSITGSVALQVLLNESLSGKDVDIIVSYDNLELLHDTLVSCNYKLVDCRSMSNLGSIVYSQDGCTSIDVFITHDIVSLVKSFDLTLVMNWITSRKVVSLYPEITMERKFYVNCPLSIQKLSNRTQKYENRGFTKLLGAVPLMTPCTFDINELTVT